MIDYLIYMSCHKIISYLNSLCYKYKLITQLCMYIFVMCINVYVWPVASIT